MSETDEIDRAWDAVEKAVHELGKLVKDVTAADDYLGRFEGYRAALSLIADNYVQQVYADRDRPEYFPWLGQVINYGGPGPDFKYGMVQLKPSATYRVWGKRGGADIIDFQLFKGWQGLKDGIKGCDSQSSFEEQNIRVDSEGNFEFILSHQKAEQGDWWPMSPEVSTILIREFFTDCTAQKEPATFHFEQIGFAEEGITAVSPAIAVEKLQALAKSLGDWGYSFRLGETIAKNNGGDNCFREEVYTGQGGQANQRFMMMRFNIPVGQALVCSWKPCDCRYWDFSLMTDHIQLFNTAYRQCSINDSAGHITQDGFFHFVISHKDPLVANWIDLDGHSVGVAIGRAKQAADIDLPVVRLVPEYEVMHYLPEDMEKMTSQERSVNLALRRAAYKVRQRC